MPSNDLGVYSHFPVLAAALAKTTGPVLELGMGWGSTPLLHTVCRAQNRTLASFETDRRWMDQFSFLEGGEVGTRTHHMYFIEDWLKGFPWATAGPYGVALIDCAPGEIRKDLALRLKGHAKFILLHDALSDPPHGAGDYRYDEIIPKFKYHEYYGVLRPPSLILSDFEPFGLSEEEQRERIVL